ncbi:hypothetical protein EV426DRAFT_36868 [Tirmania nivea]|nr:hypothetical protein EV426DRAFT_36868 [Tirmania nivea]
MRFHPCVSVVYLPTRIDSPNPAFFGLAFFLPSLILSAHVHAAALRKEKPPVQTQPVLLMQRPGRTFLRQIRYSTVCFHFFPRSLDCFITGPQIRWTTHHSGCTPKTLELGRSQGRHKEHHSFSRNPGKLSHWGKDIQPTTALSYFFGLACLLSSSNNELGARSDCNRTIGIIASSHTAPTLHLHSGTCPLSFFLVLACL